MHANRMKSLLRYVQKCSNHVFQLEQLKNYHGVKNLTPRRLRGPTTWKDMLQNAWRDTANWQTKTQNSWTNFQVLAWMITISRNRNLNQLEIYQKYAHKFSFNPCAWREMVDPTFCGQSINLLDQSQKWTRACDKRFACLISYIQSTSDYRPYCHVGNTAQHCRLGFISRLRFCWRPWGLKINLGERSCVSSEVEHYSPMVGCARSKREYPTRSTESEIISLDAGLRMDGFPALDSWDVVIGVLRSTNKHQNTN